MADVISKITLPNKAEYLIKDSGAARSDHTHATTITADSSETSSQINLSANSKYKITAGDTEYIFTTPAIPTAAQVGAVALENGVTAVTWTSNTKKLSRTINGTSADVLEFVQGSNITLTGADGKLTIAGTANDAATHTLGTTTKYYVTGTTSTSTNTSGDTFDTGVYVTATAGEISALRHSWHDTAASPAEKAYSYWNATNQSIDFVFN